MANKENKPTCSRCFGMNWIDLGVIKKGATISQVPIMDFTKNPPTETNQPDKVIPDVHLYQCGGGNAHAESEDMKQGCMRIIRATPEEMTKGGTI